MSQNQQELPSSQPVLDRKSTSNSQDFLTFITEGYEIPTAERQIRDRLLNQIPTIKTKFYRQSLFKIVSSLSELDSFSNNIEKKVDCLLQAQQTHFVESYKLHIEKIKGQFQGMNKHIEQLQEKIRYYENEGIMSHLVKKVHKLEQESAKLYEQISNKDKRIRDLQLTIKVNSSEMKRLQNTVKSNARQKSQILWKSQMQRQQSEEESQVKLQDIVLFPTQMNKHNQSFTEQRGSTLKNFISNNLSLKSVTLNIQNKTENHKVESLSKSKSISMVEDKLFNQNIKLRAKNKKLVSYQSRIVSSRDQVQDFFIKLVEQLKRQIRIRKKIEICSLQDFKKQDKLLLMIKILSNNQILNYLHERIFRNYYKKRQNSTNTKEIVTQGSSKSRQKFPKINFNISYQKK